MFSPLPFQFVVLPVDLNLPVFVLALVTMGITVRVVTPLGFALLYKLVHGLTGITMGSTKVGGVTPNRVARGGGGGKGPPTPGGGVS